MKPSFEIKYIEVQWYDRQIITKITESAYSLDPVFDDDKNCFECETTIYPNTDGLRGQIAICFNDSVDFNPSIALPNGDKKPLTPIQDLDTKKTWWIEKDKWDKKRKIWTNSGISTAGTLKLDLGFTFCQILIGSMDFTRDQLEIYLSSFKDDLWELILDDSSVIQANTGKRGVGLSQEIIYTIIQIVSNAEKIAKNPKSELREIQTLKRRKKVKPVKKTFMELASKSDLRYLTSRGTERTYNTPENKYVLFALERSYKLINQLVKSLSNKNKRYKNTIEKLLNQFESLQDTFVIDKSIVINDLETLKERCNFEFWQKKLERKIQNANLRLCKRPSIQEALFIRPTGVLGEKNGFFCEVYDEGCWKKLENKTTIFSLGESHRPLLDILSLNDEYKITGSIHYHHTERSVRFSFSRISKVELNYSESLQKSRQSFQKERAIGIEISKNNWTRVLNKYEKEEQIREKNALQNRINFYRENQANSQKICDAITSKASQLLLIIKSLIKLGITSSSNFPNSMTFVQNPHYQAVHNSYISLRTITNLADDELLHDLEEIDAIGLVNMPLLYERWCLLQIIRCFKDNFRFKPLNNWKFSLLKALKHQITDIEIDLSNEESQRYVKITYEKTLENGKRPDFVIDLTWDNNSPDIVQSFSKRFVMDAKFYNHSTFKRYGGFIGVIDKLRIEKNYQENINAPNPVFIIHPSKNILPSKITSQSWGDHSYLGELAFEKGVRMPNHQFGGIYLSPIDKLIYADELQRLIGLFLQYKLEDSNTNKRLRCDDRTLSKPFCIRCGSANLNLIPKNSGYRNRNGERVARTPKSVWMQCCDCEQFISFNHCRNDGTRLIKNGIYWTFHSAKALEPFNIKCPSCGDCGDW